MAKKKAAEPTAEAPAEEAAAPAEKMTRREAVEKALSAGKESPAEGVPYVQEQFDIALSNQAFSTIKSKIKNGGSGAAPKKKPGRPPAAANGAAAHQSAVAPTAGKVMNAAELAQAVKELVAAHGAETVKAMADVFAK